MVGPLFGGEREHMNIHRNVEEFSHHHCRHCRHRDDDRHCQERERVEPFETRLCVPDGRRAIIELLDSDGRIRGRSVCQNGEMLRILME